MTLEPKLVVLDMDGTLIDPQCEHFFENANRIFSEMALPKFDFKIMQDYYSQHRFFDILQEQRTPQLERAFWARYNESVKIPEAKLIAGAHEAIEHCVYNGAEIALATARPNSEEEIRNLLNDSALLKHISIVSTWHQTDWINKQIQLSQICKKLNIDPKESAKIGDMPTDIISAKLAGYGLAVSVLSGGIKKELLLEAGIANEKTRHIIINDISWLKEHLFK